jgi:hypothetical protein
MFSGAAVVVSIMKLATCGTVSLTLINAVKFFNGYEMKFGKKGNGKGGEQDEVTINLQDLQRKR